MYYADNALEAAKLDFLGIATDLCRNANKLVLHHLKAIEPSSIANVDDMDPELSDVLMELIDKKMNEGVSNYSMQAILVDIGEENLNRMTAVELLTFIAKLRKL